MSTKYKPKYKRVAQLKTIADLQQYLKEQNIDLPVDPTLIPAKQSPFAESYNYGKGKMVGNRFCILPMEGWDGTTDGRPTDFTINRWKNFARSGAKLLWGCEAVAVTPDGRANPNQLMINPENLGEFKSLYQLIIDEHAASFGKTDDLLVGLQLTHSGRFCKPYNHFKSVPRTLYSHPILDEKFNIELERALLKDSEIDDIISAFIAAAKLAKAAGFHFVDVKHCHGYLGHEFLSAYQRPGPFGGSLQNRTKFLTSVVQGIRDAVPDLEIGIRLSAFDFIPFKKGADECGVPFSENEIGYQYAFGGEENGIEINLTETFEFLEIAKSLGINLFCITAGSPYYNPHIQRPALFPPSDGYLPPEDPLAGVARQIHVTAAIKKKFPDLMIVGSAYSYLQEWLPYVGQHVLANGMADFIGLGRMVLSYPELPADILSDTVLKRAKICRTFSDCTTAPRNGIISGCYPLDPFYKKLEEAATLKSIKEQQ